MQLFSQEMNHNPSDLAARNNLAMTALLMDAQELKPFELARDVYRASPTNASYVSTYAFALHLQDKDTDALKLMDTLKPQELENPSIVGYYGIILKTAGQTNRARAYLARAFNGRLLPEERKLFETARAGL